MAQIVELPRRATRERVRVLHPLRFVEDDGAETPRGERGHVLPKDAETGLKVNIQQIQGSEALNQYRAQKLQMVVLSWLNFYGTDVIALAIRSAMRAAWRWPSAFSGTSSMP